MKEITIIGVSYDNKDYKKEKEKIKKIIDKIIDIKIKNNSDFNIKNSLIKLEKDYAIKTTPQTLFDCIKEICLENNINITTENLIVSFNSLPF